MPHTYLISYVILSITTKRSQYSWFKNPLDVSGGFLLWSSVVELIYV